MKQGDLVKVHNIGERYSTYTTLAEELNIPLVDSKKELSQDRIYHIYKSVMKSSIICCIFDPIDKEFFLVGKRGLRKAQEQCSNMLYLAKTKENEILQNFRSSKTS